MKIIKFKAENIKKLKVVEIVPKGNIVKITGKNEQAKTTVLDSILWALGGKEAIQDQPIRQGQEKGEIQLDLGEYIVTRTFSKSDSYLKVESRDGQRAAFKSPQALLDSLYSKYTFDLLAFAKADKKKQVEILLGIINLKPDLQKLEEIAGYKPRSTDPLEVINEVYKFVFEERTAVNRDLEKVKKVLESLPKGLAKVESVMIIDLVAEKERLELENRNNDKLRETTGGLINDAKIVSDNIGDIKAEIKQLQDKLTEFENLLIQKKELARVAKEEVSKLEDKDLTEINSKIATADETNEKARKWEEQEKIIADVMEFQEESDHLTKKLESIKNYKSELILNANFPIPGLDFGNGGVLYQGLPFEQASGTERLRVSMAIGMALNPNLKVIRIDEANSIDSEHMKIIEQMASENDFQIWMTLTDESGKVGVYLEDGEIKNG